MEHEVLYQGSYALLRLRLESGESIGAESGAMVSMSPGIEITTSAKGGLLGALKRSVLGGESFFMNTFTASAPGEITLAPPLPGDICALELGGRTVYAQSGAYIASTDDVEVDSKWGGAKSFIAREGFFLLKLSGWGTVFLSSYGAIHARDIGPGESYTVDTGHMVAFDDAVTYRVRRVGGLKSTLFSGEGLVCDYTGPGRVLMQTRSVDAFVRWLTPRLAKRGK